MMIQDSSVKQKPVDRKEGDSPTPDIPITPGKENVDKSKDKKPDAKKSKKVLVYGITGVVLVTLWYTGYIMQFIDWIATSTAPAVKYIQPVEVGTQDYNTEANVWTPAFKNPWQKVAWRVGVNIPYYEVRINQKDRLVFRIDPKGGDGTIPPSINIDTLEFRTPADSRVVIFQDK